MIVNDLCRRLKRCNRVQWQRLCFLVGLGLGYASVKAIAQLTYDLSSSAERFWTSVSRACRCLG